jgi:hypothetical protein
MELMNKELIFKIFILCCALLVDAEACPCVTREFPFSCKAFLPTYRGELEIIMCGKLSCTFVLCNIQTEIRVKLFDKVWEVMYVTHVSLISFEYSNHIFWKWPLVSTVRWRRCEVPTMGPLGRAAAITRWSK